MFKVMMLQATCLTDESFDVRSCWLLTKVARWPALCRFFPAHAKRKRPPAHQAPRAEDSTPVQVRGLLAKGNLNVTDCSGKAMKSYGPKAKDT